jgi:hypothetical protein
MTEVARPVTGDVPDKSKQHKFYVSHTKVIESLTALSLGLSSRSFYLLEHVSQ